MFDLNRRYNQCYNWPIVVPIIDQTCTFQFVIQMVDVSKLESALAMNRLRVWGLIF